MRRDQLRIFLVKVQKKNEGHEEHGDASHTEPITEFLYVLRERSGLERVWF